MNAISPTLFLKFKIPEMTKHLAHFKVVKLTLADVAFNTH